MFFIDLDSDIKKEMITMLINTYNGHSESIDKIPNTSKKYVSKSCIRENKINEDDLEDNTMQLMLLSFNYGLVPRDLFKNLKLLLTFPIKLI